MALPGILSEAVCARKLAVNAAAQSFPRLGFWSRQSFAPPRQRNSRNVVHRKKAPTRRSVARSVLTESQPLEMGTRAPDFSLPEPLTGRRVALADFEGHPALLVVFTCNHCPFAIHVREQLVTLAREYADKGRHCSLSLVSFPSLRFPPALQHGVAVVAISSNSVATHPQDGPELMARQAEEFAFPFPYLFDETQEVAKAYGAACTPDFFLFRKDGRRPFELAYHGQLDDSRPSNGKPVTGRDLRLALDCVLSGRPVPGRQKPSIGCNIKWHPGKEPEYFRP